MVTEVVLKTLESVESANQSWFEEAKSHLTINSKPLDKSITNEKPSLLSDKNSLEISIQPEQLLSLIQSGALSNFNVKINVA
ncbi:15993_t:CDS:2, partial [Rhizophagus irregularis]